MAFQIDKFLVLRPFLFHFTAHANLEHVREARSISPAAELMKCAGRHDPVRQKRRGPHKIEVAGRERHLRDQDPLHRGNIEFQGGWEFEDLVEKLNGLVFFWPGSHKGPISYGIRHFQRYEHEKPAVLRVKFESLLEENPGLDPLFCRYNSGSPRCSNGRKSPRGPETFARAAEFPYPASAVVEVTFNRTVVLPRDSEYGSSPWGRWKPLF